MGRGGVDLVGTKDQIFRQIQFEGSPNWFMINQSANNKHECKRVEVNVTGIVPCSYEVGRGVSPCPPWCYMWDGCPGLGDAHPPLLSWNGQWPASMPAGQAGGSRGPHPRPSTPLPSKPTSMHLDPKLKHRRQKQGGEVTIRAKINGKCPYKCEQLNGGQHRKSRTVSIC